MNFTPDIRNIGGRKTISDILSNHYSKLDCAKATINSRESQTQSPSLKTQKSKQNSRYESTSRSQLKKRKGKLNENLMWEHQNNIKHMQRRIKDIGSILERKKNKFDPISYPVKFFRETPEEAPGLPRVYIQKMLKPLRTSNVYNGNLKEFEFHRKAFTPLAWSKETESIEFVRNQLLKEIVDKRIYKDSDLMTLFGNARRLYSKFKPLVVENAIRRVKVDFDV